MIKRLFGFAVLCTIVGSMAVHQAEAVPVIAQPVTREMSTSSGISVARRCNGDVKSQQDIFSNASSYPNWGRAADSVWSSLGDPSGDRPFAFFRVFAMACSQLIGGQVVAYLESNPTVRYSMLPSPTSPLRRYSEGCDIDIYSHCYSGSWYLDTSTMETGTYRWQIGGFKNESGFTSGLSEATGFYNGNWRPVSFQVRSWSSTTTSTTIAPPLPGVPEVLEDDLTLVVHTPNKFASAYYSAIVRCSNRCGKLPDVFPAKLCEVGTSYRSATCISSASMSPNGSKKKVTKTSTTNMFFGTFAFNKAPTGKRYRVYLNIPAGRNHAPVEGKATVAWTRKTANPPTTTTIPAPTTTTLPGVTTTTTPTTTIAPSNQPVAVISDRVAGLSTAVVQGANTSVGVEVTLSCTGKCTALPSYINARLCKVGTSYLDASCTTAQSIVRTSGTLNSTYFGQLRLGLDPTGLKYQPYFSILATGVSGYVRIGGTSRLTWTK